jgi:hypothetical protein
MQLSFIGLIEFILWVVFIDCIGVGVLIASLYWYVSNRFLIRNATSNQDVEWAYCFDVHLNAFLPLLLVLHLFQLPFLMSKMSSCFRYKLFAGLTCISFLKAVINHDWYISSIIGNTFWLVAISYYFYNLFLGFKGKISSKLYFSN